MVRWDGEVAEVECVTKKANSTPPHSAHSPLPSRRVQPIWKATALIDVLLYVLTCSPSSSSLRSKDVACFLALKDGLNEERNEVKRRHKRKSNG